MQRHADTRRSSYPEDKICVWWAAGQKLLKYLLPRVAKTISFKERYRVTLCLCQIKPSSLWPWLRSATDCRLDPKLMIINLEQLERHLFNLSHKVTVFTRIQGGVPVFFHLRHIYSTYIDMQKMLTLNIVKIGTRNVRIEFAKIKHTPSTYYRGNPPPSYRSYDPESVSPGLRLEFLKEGEPSRSDRYPESQSGKNLAEVWWSPHQTNSRRTLRNHRNMISTRNPGYHHNCYTFPSTVSIVAPTPAL